MTKYIKCAFGAHYLALSRSISQGAGFKHYLCKRKDGTDPPQPQTLKDPSPSLPQGEGVITTD